MKKQLLLLLLLFLITRIEVMSTIITVNNNPNSPGQFSDLISALAVANSGDTIMVAASSAYYGRVTITKPLTLIGEGYRHPTKPVTQVDFVITGDSIKIMGFRTTIFFNNNNSSYSVDPIRDVIVERCEIVDKTFNQTTTRWSIDFRGQYNGGNGRLYKNIIFRNNVFLTPEVRFYKGRDTGVRLDTLIFENNIFSNTRFAVWGSYAGHLTGEETLIIRHNNFLNEYSAIFSYLSGVVVKDNIFHNARPAGCSGCTFLRNLTYNIPVGDTLLYGNNVGGGNINLTDPQMINYTSGNFSFNHNYYLQPTSPAKNAATDSTDIGITGGAWPFTVGANPHIPQVLYVNATKSAVRQNGKLLIRFKATKQE